MTHPMRNGAASGYRNGAPADRGSAPGHRNGAAPGYRSGALFGSADVRPGTLQLVVPWAVGLGVLLVTQVLVVVLAWDVAAGGSARAWDSSIRGVLLVQLPTVISFALGTWAAAAVHRAPSRDALARHCLAAFGPAVALQLVTFATTTGGPSLPNALVQLAVLAAGCALGFLADRLRHR